MTAGAALLGAAAWQAQPEARKVAVTVDDLPVQHAADAATARRISKALLDTFRKRRIPAIGFVNEQRPHEAQTPTREILNQWLDAGMELGNHTYSHLDGNRVPLDRYTADVAKGEPLIKDMLAARGRKLTFFRHPFLHTGADAATKQGMAAYLGQRGYVTAPVTFDNQEWVFSAAYERAYGRRDQAALRRIAAAYVNYMEENFAFFEQRSRQVLGREPAQVLLIHCNRINADHFSAVAERLRMRGYRFVSLEEAMRDEAYRLEDPYAGPKGLSWIHRWGMGKGMPVDEEPREPEWVSRMMAGD